LSKIPFRENGLPTTVAYQKTAKISKVRIITVWLFQKWWGKGYKTEFKIRKMCTGHRIVPAKFIFAEQK
jgi:RimJ/RimL family protein N-acetyltransferase